LRLSNNSEEVLKLKKENDELKKKNNEMVKFLKEYGLNWVGTEASEQNRKDLDVA